MRGADLYSLVGISDQRSIHAANERFLQIRAQLCIAGKAPSVLRDRLLRVLIVNDSPVSIQELRQLDGENASVMTTHRLLNDLVELELAVKLTGGSRSFVRREGGSVHVVVCKQCGKQIAFQAAVLTEWVSSLPAHRKSQSESSAATFYGQCYSCRTKKNAE